MPRLSDSMEEATVLEWLKQPGDAVAQGRAARRGGDRQGDDRLRGRGRRCARGDRRRRGRDRGALGAVIARVRRRGRGAAARHRAACLRRPEPAIAPTAVRRPSPSSPRGTPAPQAVGESGRHRATPVARRLARELGVSLEGVAGTGPGRPDRPRRRPGARPETAAPRLRGSPATARGTWRRSRSRRRSGRSRSACPSRGRRSPTSRSRRRSTWRRAARLREELRELGPGAAAVVQRPRRQGGRARAPRVPGPERVVRRTARRSATPGQRRHRRRDRRRALRADDPRRRPEVGVRDRRRVAPSGREGSVAGRSRWTTSPTAPSPSPTSACSACAASTP